ncbi:MAG: hypothetical protein AAFR37_01855 [Cyanobacteria bacterium J06628_3]
MNSFFNEEEELEQGEVIPDTPIPQDLHAHLEERKKQRKKIIVTTEKITTFTFAWSLNASGYLVARYLLITGGAINFGLAVSLCFSISSVSSCDLNHFCAKKLNHTLTGVNEIQGYSV